MWVRGTHIAIDNQGRQVSRDISINLNLAICYVELDEERTRVFYSVGHDIEDHRNASWVDLHEPKSKVDGLLYRQTEPNNRKRQPLTDQRRTGPAES